VSQSDGREAFPGAADLPPVSESAIRAFSEALPKLLSLVNDKFAVDERVLKKQQPEDLKFIYDAHHHFGDMLRAVYEFDLYDHMLGEFAWYVSALSSRGFKESYFRKMVEAWMIAIHSSIRPPESGELTVSLEYLCRHLHAAYSASGAEAAPLGSEAKHFLGLLLDNKRTDAAEYVLERLAGGDRVERLYSGMLLPALNKVGLLWQRNKISVADEHAATEILRYVLFRLIDTLPRKNQFGMRALVACVPGEEHDVGAHMASGLLRAEGWDVVYVGRSAPEEEIVKALDSSRPQMAVFSVSLIARLPAARDLFVTVRGRFAGTGIITGGRAAVAARAVLEKYVDAVVEGLEDLHETALRLVGRDA
jgi:methanogenic corrinoid protein MtbC1